ncbi:MAG: Cu(I)-responsive transcriptional regulator [Candidatus Puniceispirillaceae bacterium]
MNISTAAAKASLTVKTVRYYDSIGLVSPYQNPQTGYRDYAEVDIAKLQFVGTARRFNFSIEECRELLSLYEDKNRSSETVKALTVQKIAEIEDRLAELTALRDQLAHLARSCHGDHRPDCPILDAFSTREGLSPPSSS